MFVFIVDNLELVFFFGAHIDLKILASTNTKLKMMNLRDGPPAKGNKWLKLNCKISQDDKDFLLDALGPSSCVNYLSISNAIFEGGSMIMLADIIKDNTSIKDISIWEMPNVSDIDMAYLLDSFCNISSLESMSLTGEAVFKFWEPLSKIHVRALSIKDFCSLSIYDNLANVIAQNCCLKTVDLICSHGNILPVEDSEIYKLANSLKTKSFDSLLLGHCGVASLFLNALNGVETKTLSIFGTNFDDNSVPDLLGSIKNLKDVQLYKCNFGTEAIMNLYAVLEHNTTIESITHLRYPEDSNMSCLGRMLSTNKKLKCLEFSGSNVTYDLAGLELGLALNSTLVVLSLNGNKLTNINAFAKGLKFNITLQKISLSRCGITDVGIELISKALPSCNVKKLLVSSNPITNKGIKILARCAPQTQLETLDISMCDIKPRGINYLLSVLPFSNIKVLNCKTRKPFGNDTALKLAEILPSSKLETLQIKINTTNHSARPLINAIKFSFTLRQTNLSDQLNRFIYPEDDIRKIEETLEEKYKQTLYSKFNCKPARQ